MRLSSLISLTVTLGLTSPKLFGGTFARVRGSSTGDTQVLSTTSKLVVPKPTGALISPEQPLDVPVFGGMTPNNTSSARTASNGRIFLTVWVEGALDGETDLMGARMTHTGELLDPIGFPISTAAGDQFNPAVASDGEHFLVVWVDTRDGHRRLFGGRVSSGGIVLDPQGFALTREGEGGFAYPLVASNRREYLVAWGLFSNVFGRRVALDGTLIDETPITIASYPFALPNAVVSNGQDFLVVWEGRSEDDFNAGHILGTRVNHDGKVLDPDGIRMSVASGTQHSPVAGSANGDYLVVWVDSSSGNDPTGIRLDIYGARVTASGTVLDQNGIPISVAAGQQHAPAVASDGSDYLVTWSDARGPNNFRCTGARVTFGGVVLEKEGFPIGTLTGIPTVAFANSNYVVVANELRNVAAMRVSTAGEVLDSTARSLISAANEQIKPVVARNGDNALLAWLDNRLRPRSAGSLTEYDVFVGRTSGNDMVGQPSPVAPAGRSGLRPSVASNGQSFLVLSQMAQPFFVALQATLYNSSGSAVTNVILPFTENVSFEPVVTSNGRDYLISWVSSIVRIDASGTLLDPVPVRISDVPSLIWAAASDGENFLLAWTRKIDQVRWELAVTQVAATGDIFSLHHTSLPDANPYTLALAGNGEGYLLAWFTSTTTFPTKLFAMRFNPKGDPIDSAPFVVATIPGTGASLRSTARENEFLLVWETQFPNISLLPNEVLAARVSTEGLPLDSPPLRLAASTALGRYPTAVPEGSGYRVIYQGSDLRNIQRLFSKTIQIQAASSWRNQDIGHPGLTGGVRATNDVFTVSGSGLGLKGLRDNAHFMYREIEGDFEFVAQLSNLQNATPRSYAGVMAREGLSDRSRFVSVGTFDGRQATFRQRSVPLGTAAGFTLPGEANWWFKLARVQDALAGFVSQDGQTWKLVDFTFVGSTNRIHVGPVVDSGTRDLLTVAEFLSISLKPISSPLLAANVTKPLLRIGSESGGSEADQRIHLLVAGPAGASYVVEASDTFVDWQPLGVLTNQFGIASFSIPTENLRDTRFFRLRSNP